MTFNGEKDEHSLVEEGPQIERCGGEDILVEDTCHRETRETRDKRFEMFFFPGQCKVGTFNEEEDEDTLVTSN